MPRGRLSPSTTACIRIQAKRGIAVKRSRSPGVEAGVPGVQVAGPPGRGDGDGASAADEVQSTPSVTLEFPGLRLTVRTPATADAAAAAAGGGTPSDAPSTATARRAPGTAPGMFAGGAVDPTPLHTSPSAAGLLASRSDVAPTVASDGHHFVRTRPKPARNSPRACVPPRWCCCALRTLSHGDVSEQRRREMTV